MGVNFTLNHLQEKYFVVQLRQQVKRCIKECAEYNRRFRGYPSQHQMAPSHRIRLEMTRRTFANCATDFAGPFYTMQGRSRPRMKRYLCVMPIFVCVLKCADKYGSFKEHYHVFAHAQEFDFRTGGQEIKDAGIDIELSQIRLHRPQSTLASP